MPQPTGAACDEFPKLTVLLQQFGRCDRPYEHNSDACCSLTEKLAYLAGSSLSNSKTLKLESLWGHLSSLLPPDTSPDNKSSLQKLLNLYIDACLQFVGKDTTDLSQFGCTAALLGFGRLGPIMLDLFERRVSVEDIHRHHLIQREKQAITNQLGGAGAQNLDEAWKLWCKSLADLLNHRALRNQGDELQGLMRKCRVATEDDSSSEATLPENLKIRPPTNAEYEKISRGVTLDWTALEANWNLIGHISHIIKSTIFAPPSGAENRSTTKMTSNSCTATEMFRSELSKSIADGSVSKTETDTSGSHSVAALIEQLAPSAENLNLSGEELVNMIFKLLQSSGQSPNEITNEICELIGWNDMDLVIPLVDRRDEWLNAYQSYKSSKANPPDGRKTPTTKTKNLVESLLNDPASVAVAREAQREQNRRETNERLRRAMKNGPTQPTRPRYPHVFDAALDFRDSVALSNSTKLQLPVGTDFKQLPQWDIVQFPCPSRPPGSVMNVERIKVSSMDSIGQKVFEGMNELNLIQSVVYPTAYYTSENLLVSAPTGAGKTNVALLSICQLLRSHLKPDSVLDLNAFKIVYLAPMKALAAELTATFSRRLAPLGVKVRECTGDMQLTKQEILETQMLVSTPEKWDVISRKGSGDATMVKLVKLLIIDEIHLLHEDRGAVIEVLVARTLRQVETSQTMIRLVGLSATLPNYEDVARFLHVNPYQGLFYFDDRFRPVPLRMSFIGVRGSGRTTQERNMNLACYEKVLEQVRNGEQVMVFVHARGDTFRTARYLRDTAQQEQTMDFFRPPKRPDSNLILKKMERSDDIVLRNLMPDGFACHHAGMLRYDRSLVERLFAEGHIRVLVCTATLAWGVNLPAHAVIIKGTRVYKAEKSDFTDLDILDVLQIFGRAGRPQFDSLGVATIITSLDKLDHYLRLITNQHPIESTLLRNLQDHLNAEIALGTITNVDEAVQWLGDTYLAIRLQKNPMHYGVPGNVSEIEFKLKIADYLREAIKSSAKDLDGAEMIRFEPQTGQLASTDRGRTASLYYIQFSTASMVRDSLEATMLTPELLSILSEATEFASMKVRDEEGEELNNLKKSSCHVAIRTPGTVDTDVPAKVNALLQGYISRRSPSCHSLASDMYYIQQNAGRLVRYLFEISLRQGWSQCSSTALHLARMIERRQWDEQTPLWQFSEASSVPLLQRVDELTLSIDRIRETDVNELAHLLHYRGRDGAKEVSRLASYLPRVQVTAETQPITRTILRVSLTLEPDFTWFDRWHGMQQNFWIWIEDPDQGCIYHSEYWTLTKRLYKSKDPISVTFTIPLFEPFPNQYITRVMSDQWLGADTVCPISFKRLILPPSDPPHTDLLGLQPLSVTALNNPQYEMLYNFTHFNPIQTQIFHTLYHQDVNVLLGAPTGSGKTVAAELAMFRVFDTDPKKKCVYIAPMKALVRERIEDWSERIGKRLGKRVVELTGDVTPDISQLLRADLIVTTPEKWDGISRSWQQRAYVRHIALIIIDEIHLLGEERGPVLEVLVSRANYIADQLGQSVRIVGLSTALSNAPDLACWLRVPTTMTSIAEVAAATGSGVGQIGRGMFNFRPSVRPVPLETHIQGYPGRHYCPRMATMNRPIYQAIGSHSPNKPVLIFVSSRRQTRLTGLDLVSFIAASGDSKKWLHMDPTEMEELASTVLDPNLRLTLSFGIGLHHAGLRARDRQITEELFGNQKIQILIATATLAWGVNFPAHLVIIKGTEYYDGKTKRYIDYPITDVLQMMGRAGRPQYDKEGKAVIMVQDTKKTFYKRFLYEPFPVESCLLQVLPDHLNAEVVAGTITSLQEALDYLTWTFFFRRLLANPSYYGLEDCQPNSVSSFLSSVVSKACNELLASSCLESAPDRPDGLVPTELGRLASFYYLSHKTILLFTERLRSDSTVHNLLEILASAHEYATFPVRHCEDDMNRQLAKLLPLPMIGPPDESKTKVHLLLQAHFSRLAELPVADYFTDTRSVLEQAGRILQAMLDASAQCGWLTTCLNCLILMQMIAQGLWVEDVGSSLLQLPSLHPNHLEHLRRPDRSYIDSLPELIDFVQTDGSRIDAMLSNSIRPEPLDRMKQVLRQFPLIEISLSLAGPDPVRDDFPTQSIRSIRLNRNGQSTSALTVFAETEYVLRVRLTLLNPRPRGSNQPVITAPSVKSKLHEGWVLLLGNSDMNKSSGGGLLALKRVPPKGVIRPRVAAAPGRSAADGHALSMAFQLPPPPPSPNAQIQPRQQHQITLFLMSDTYLGLDQQISILLEAIPSPIDTTAESELMEMYEEKDL
ncbi:unnamed protein product [Calicophoron daubneyi]|uniref:Activating signal cointegrator 1 complex subunit 3 n=1 Tax=Calicophoron daubneyi TaxID=300641 RepID=A0AAV2TTH9_CALDB